MEPGEKITRKQKKNFTGFYTEDDPKVQCKNENITLLIINNNHKKANNMIRNLEEY